MSEAMPIYMALSTRFFLKRRMVLRIASYRIGLLVEGDLSLLDVDKK